MTGAPGKIRVMWLLNHTTARAFEVGQLQAMGIDEIFVPKSVPLDDAHFSSSVDYSLDATLTIPAEDLAILNAANWHEDPGAEALAVANRHFHIAFFGFFPRQIETLTRHFQGVCILRAYGLQPEHTYSDVIYTELGASTVDRIRQMGNRFWFGQAYGHLHEQEHRFLRQRACHLPLGLADAALDDRWTGEDKQVLFICPRIATSPYYEDLYRNFLTLAEGLPYAIGGAQPIPVPDPNVLGFVSRDAHDANMRRAGVMFYHDSGPFHVHCHPFEAIRNGLPLIFMGGGMLDKLGGRELPGRCETPKQARRKIERVLGGDRKFIARLKRTQATLLHAMDPIPLSQVWRENFSEILSLIEGDRLTPPRQKPKKIAVMLPVPYRGGTLRGAKMMATAIHHGSRLAGEPVDVVFGYPDEPHDIAAAGLQSGLPPDIPFRVFHWDRLDTQTANTAMRLAGHEWTLPGERYVAPNDGIQGFLDCDFWMIVSDRLDTPLLPIRPYGMVVYDYIQRYRTFLPPEMEQAFIDAARGAEAVIVTTRFTANDARQYAGIDDRKVHLLPMTSPAIPAVGAPRAERPYFVWPTNPAPHKNHLNSFRALQIYYEELDGALDCRITGERTDGLLKGGAAHLEPLEPLVRGSVPLQNRVELLGELPDPAYYRQVAGASFLWHTATIDNGTFSVVEAAALGTPALSTDYPAMREMDDIFDLNLMWCSAANPNDMAQQLKRMEQDFEKRRGRLPERDAILAKNALSAAPAYWEALRSCL